MKFALFISLLLVGCSSPPVQNTVSPKASATPPAIARATPQPIAPPAGAKVIMPGEHWQEQAVQASKAQGVAYLGAGNFTTPALVLMDGAHFVGAGPEFTHIISPASHSVVTLGAGEMVLEHLSISHDGDAIGSLVQASKGHLELKDCKLSDSTDDAVKLGGDCRATLSDCQFLSNLRSGVTQAQHSSASASNCSFDLQGGYSWEGGDGSNTTLSLCSFMGGTTPAVYLHDRGLKVVNACHFGEAPQGGLAIGNHTVATVTNCTVENVTANGIEIHGQATVVNNTCTRGGAVGILFLDEGSGTASNNTCTDNQLAGIEVGQKGHPVLTGNHCSGNASGLSFFENAAGAASDNFLDKNLHGGIRIEAPAHPQIGSNHFQENGEGEVVNDKP